MRITETIGFQRFHLRANRTSYLGVQETWEIRDDRETLLRKLGPCRPWLAQRTPPFQLRRLLRFGSHGLGGDPGLERRRDRRELRLPGASAQGHGDHHLCPLG